LLYGLRAELRQRIARTPILWRWSHLLDPKFPGTAAYWESRYKRGGNSGDGSYRHLAEFKAEVLNAFVAEHDIRVVAEFGCGDGNQLRYARYPRYIGIDISPTAVAQCVEMFRGDTTKSFFVDDGKTDLVALCKDADLALSLDVIYHLVEENLFRRYMETLFASSSRYVIIYSSDENEILENAHVRQWKFTEYVAATFPQWRLEQKIANKYPSDSWADFFIFHKAAQK